MSSAVHVSCSVKVQYEPMLGNAGRLFHVCEAAAGNAWSSMVDHWVGWDYECCGVGRTETANMDMIRCPVVHLSQNKDLIEHWSDCDNWSTFLTLVFMCSGIHHNMQCCMVYLSLHLKTVLIAEMDCWCCRH